MFSEEFTREAGSFLEGQARQLLAKQSAVAAQSFRTRTGLLSKALGGTAVSSATHGEISVTVAYPKHIRYLDMRRNAAGKKKANYAPIYNKYVYGFLKSGVWRWINAHLPGVIARAVEDTFREM